MTSFHVFFKQIWRSFGEVINRHTYNKFVKFRFRKFDYVLIRGLVNDLPLVKFTPILVLSLYMTVKCPVRARWRINCTISGLIVTTERGNSQFEYCYKVVILLINFHIESLLCSSLKRLFIIRFLI